MLEDVVVIVGAGHAGVHAAVRLAAWPGRVVVIDEQSGETYERPPLSKDFLKAEGQGDASIPPLRKEQFFADKSIERVHGRVESIDRRAHLVHIAGGRSIAYTKLILAPGSAPRALRIPGGSLTGVHLLKTRDDAVALRDALRPGRRVVIVGAGYIGLEVAAAAAVIGCETTVLEYADRVMSRVTSHPVSAFFERLHTEHGTRFVFGAEVTAISGDGHVESVMTADGSSYPADVVVAGIGVVPNHHLAEAAGLDVRDGIIVDADSRTSDPDVYACGDATRLVDAEAGVDRRLESIQSAQAQATNAANSIMGSARGKDEVPWFWTIQHGVRLQTAGLRRPDDQIVLRGRFADGRCTVLYVRDGRLAALDTVGSLSDFTAGKKLIARATPIDVDAAADVSIKLGEAIPAPQTSTL